MSENIDRASISDNMVKRMKCFLIFLKINDWHVPVHFRYRTLKTGMILHKVNLDNLRCFKVSTDRLDIFYSHLKWTLPVPY